MTHGYLRIKTPQRSALLHTYHSGQFIPGCLEKVFALFAAEYASKLWQSKQPSITVEEVAELLVMGAAFDELAYAPTLAGLFIAARPFFLHPVPLSARRDLPTWGKTGHEYRLLVKDSTWQLFRNNELVTSLDFTERAVMSVTAALKA